MAEVEKFSGPYWEHRWNIATKPGDTEIVHECFYCGKRIEGARARLPKLGCTVRPKGGKD